MMAVGRVSSVIVVLAVASLSLLASAFPDLMHIGPVHVVDWIGLALFVSVPVTWISAMVHWARRFPTEGRRNLWGVVVVLGFVPGAIVYWFWGVGRLASAVESTP